MWKCIKRLLSIFSQNMHRNRNASFGASGKKFHDCESLGANVLRRNRGIFRLWWLAERRCWRPETSETDTQSQLSSSLGEATWSSRPRTYLLKSGSYDESIYRLHLTVLPTLYSHVSPAFPTGHQDDGCGLLPHVVWTFRSFVSLQSAGDRFRFLVPTSLQVTSAPSLSVFRQWPFCFPVSTKTLSYDSCVPITIHHYYLDTCGHCNN